MSGRPRKRTAYRYQDLADFATTRGHSRVTAAAVQGWLKSGLLPRASWHHWGQGHRSATYSVATGRQLLTLCEIRFGREPVRRHSHLAVALWLKGFNVDLGSVRGGLMWFADMETAARSASRLPTGDIWDAINVAVYEHGFGSDAAQTGIAKSAIAQGLGDLFDAFAGRPSGAPDTEGLVAMTHLIGLQRAATDHAPGGRPWLSQPPVAALQSATAALTSGRLRAAVAAASDEDLHVARDRALTLVASVLEACSAVPGSPENFAGLPVVARFLQTPTGPVMAVLSVLADPAGNERVDITL